MTGDIDIANSASWGVVLDIDLHDGAQLELLYNRQDSHVDVIRYPAGIKENLGDLSVDYYQIGALYRQAIDSFEPFGLFTLGATRFAPKNAAYSDAWRFSVIFGLGTKVWLSQMIGLRLQGRLLMPINWSGGGLWCGFGGCNVGVGGGSSMPQFDVGLGLAFRFGQ